MDNLSEKVEVTILYNDACDLVEKKDHEGKKWLYEYGANGLLSKVTRPDKNEVTFEYDPLGRRVSKTYKDKTTKFLWDGNKVIHEWKEYETEQQSTAQNIITWLYKDGSFVPIGKLTENDSYSIVTDHLGTPTEMYNSKGERVWKVIKDIYGRTRHKVGGETPETDCQIRYQGQYEDYEAGVYYNRFRYYMPDEGMYSQRDPIGIAGGNPSLYGYVWDSTKQVDVFGLDVAQGVGNNVNGPWAGDDIGSSLRNVGNNSVVDIIVTDDIIRNAMKDAELQTVQTAVSKPPIQNYVDRILAGEVDVPPIKVNNGVIIDGNHRYIAGKITGIDIPTTGGGTTSKSIIDWNDVFLDPVAWGNR